MEEKHLTIEGARQLAKSRLSEKRYQHTSNVRDMAVELARLYGVDEDKAALAAWLHDTAKEMPKAELLQILRDNAIIRNDPPERPAPVWHGLAAAVLARDVWGVTDADVLAAVENHTTGRPGMSKLEKVVFLADMTCAERDFPGVDMLRRLARQDLDTAMLAALKHTLDFVKSTGKPVDPMSQATYEDLLKRTEGNDKT